MNPAQAMEALKNLVSGQSLKDLRKVKRMLQRRGYDSYVDLGRNRMRISWEGYPLAVISDAVHYVH